MKKIYPCVVGLGYVGLPLFISLKKKFKVVGFDINKKRVNDLRQLNDRNKEFKKKDLRLVNNSSLTYNKIDIKNSNFYIITVPTPIKKNNIPDLKYVKSAFKIIANYITNNDIIFLESTVYPGTTLKICRNIIKNKKKNINFYIGYSSERINPGDKIHNIKNIAKVVSINANKEINDIVKKVYCNVSKKIIFTKKINEAELSKLIENTQRDLNIGLMNELMILCEKSNLDFNEVLRLANTKWNFLRFKPGLVGGHCLPVDPYYLSYYAKNLKYNTKITLAARYTNNYMEKFIFKKTYTTILLIVVTVFSIIYTNHQISNDRTVESRIGSINMQDSSISDRALYFSDALNSIIKNPILGIGLGNWKLVSIKYDKDNSYYSNS